MDKKILDCGIFLGCLGLIIATINLFGFVDGKIWIYIAMLIAVLMVIIVMYSMIFFVNDVIVDRQNQRGMKNARQKPLP